MVNNRGRGGYVLLSFRKYQALLNDYILFNAIDGMLKLSPTQIVELCHRRRGIGADGVLVVSREDGQYRMEIFNADGSLATMCGNGLRCVGKFLADTQRIPIGTRIPIRTRAGLRSVTVQQHTPAASHVSASMLVLAYRCWESSHRTFSGNKSKPEPSLASCRTCCNHWPWLRTRYERGCQRWICLYQWQ